MTNFKTKNIGTDEIAKNINMSYNELKSETSAEFENECFYARFFIAQWKELDTQCMTVKEIAKNLK